MIVKVSCHVHIAVLCTVLHALKPAITDSTAGNPIDNRLHVSVLLCLEASHCAAAVSFHAIVTWTVCEPPLLLLECLLQV